ncbi:MAG: hypothetical protein ACKO1Y_01590, partial [Actinomycetota bacterium]
PPEHPNLPRRGLLALSFLGIACAGVLGGTIGYGLVGVSCSDAPTRAERLLTETVPGFIAGGGTCARSALVVAVVATVLSAVGAGIVAVLLLRSQSEWRSHSPRPSGGR